MSQVPIRILRGCSLVFLQSGTLVRWILYCAFTEGKIQAELAVVVICKSEDAVMRVLTHHFDL